MRNRIVIAENHSFSMTMNESYGERGHFIAKCCANPKVLLDELNAGKLINRPGDIRDGSVTRPLCNDPNWRITTLIEFAACGRTGDYLVSRLKHISRKPLGMRRLEKMLKLDDQIRFDSAACLPLLGNNIKSVFVPNYNFCDIDTEDPVTMFTYCVKMQRDHSITSAMEEEGISFNHLI